MHAENAMDTTITVVDLERMRKVSQQQRDSARRCSRRRHG